jgi:hypothetical protein
MPSAQQNALVRKYCAVCHTDAAKSGGLSLEHFDAAQAAPSLTAMLLSKLTGGVSLDMARGVGSDASAAALVNKKMKSGAMGASGIPIPDKATIDALIQAFAAESSGAAEWTVERTKDGTAEAPRLTASLLRDMPSAQNAGEATAYRLLVSCDLVAHDGFVQLTWSPLPKSGTLTARADEKVAVRYPVEGGESLVLAGLPLPVESLTVSDLFPGETIMFSFTNLPNDARHDFEACFPNANSAAASTAAESRRSTEP